MALPKQVQDQLAAADAALAAAHAKPAEGDDLATLAAQGQVTGDPVVNEVPPTQVAQSEAPAPQPAAPQESEWEHRYKVLQGKYNKEVPALHADVRNLRADLQAAIERLDAAAKAPAAQPSPQVQADPKDVDAFGQDMVSMVQRVSSSVADKLASVYDARFAKIEAAIQQLGTNVQGTAETITKTAEELFFDRLTKLVPEWEQVNVNPAFIAWLAEPDPVYGVPRQQALNQARNTMNADHAANVFRAFMGPGKPVEPKVDPLDKQVSPKGAAAPAPTPQEAPVIKQSAIAKFYDDARRGVYAGNEAEFQRIEAFINLAIAEGRVR